MSNFVIYIAYVVCWCNETKEFIVHCACKIEWNLVG
jgi:hypothetical protein